MRLKFDIAHFVATQKIPFTMYPRICELETHHGVCLGTSYVNETAGKEIMHYIAESRRQELKQRLATAKFFPLLLDGSTDAANIDNELILAVWCDRDGRDERIHTRMEYLTVVQPVCDSQRPLQCVGGWAAVSRNHINLSREVCEAGWNRHRWCIC